MSEEKQLPLGRHGVGYLEVRGPAGEAICTIFPDAGLGGIGLEQARAVARLIVEARHALDEPRNDRRSEVRP